MEIKLNKFAWKLFSLGFWLLTISLAISSCSCGDKSDGIVDDDIDDDNNDTDDDIAEGWYVYTIDPELGNFPSIGTDSSNKIHVAYHVSDRDLMYATNSSGGWQLFNIETINPGATYYISAALDSRDKVHISYYEPYKRLKYATNKSGSWQIFVVKDGLTSGGDGPNSIDVDSSGKVHIVFFLCGGLNENEECKVGDLKYATNKSDSWQILTIDDPGDDVEAGRDYLSMVVDSNDKIHVSYYRCSDCVMMGGTAELWYATNATGSWQKTEVGNDVFGDFFGGYNSIAVDSSGKVHISFYDKNKNLCYATNASGAWEIVTVDSTKGAGIRNSIAVDSEGITHIAYVIADDNSLKYATNKTGGWQIFTIDSEDEIDNSFLSIDIDSNDYVHIGYISIKGVKYATNRPPDR